MITKGDIIWVVGKINLALSVKWELCGIFETEEEAVTICSSLNHFVGPVEFGKVLPEEPTSWPNCYYPKG